jgi:hypothetical protein
MHHRKVYKEVLNGLKGPPQKSEHIANPKMKKKRLPPYLSFLK